MRTTANLERDVAAAVDQLRRQRSLGVSEAVNELIQAGLTNRREGSPFEQRSRPLALRVDLTNVAETLEQLEGPTHH